MKIIIHGHHLEVTAAIKAHLNDKLELIKKHFHEIIQINVSLLVDKTQEKEHRQTAELSIHILGKDLFSQAHHQDLYLAIDAAVQKLDKQILKLKERTKNHHLPLHPKYKLDNLAGLNL
jgi:putative sigma-54 modulation protein